MRRFPEGSFRKVLISAIALAVCVGTPASANLVITPTFTANFSTNFGVNAANAMAAWNAAAGIFESNFSDNIHINITVDAVSGTGVFGQSSTSLVSSTYANLRTRVVGDATTADDATSVGGGGSVTAADPVGGTHTWWVSKSEAKALGIIPDDGTSDGTTTFGAGNPFSFSGTPPPGQYDFEGVAAHEIAEVMGRLGLSGTTIGGNVNSFSLMDLFAFTGAGARGLTPGPNENFSIDDGTTLLKLYNDASANGLDTRDWAPGSNDSFNQFSNSGVINPVSIVDLREMDVIGYDRIFSAAVPEPSTLLLISVGGLALLGASRRRNRRSA